MWNVMQKLALALGFVTVLGAGMRTTIFAIALVYIPIFSRVARAPVLALSHWLHSTAQPALP